MHVFYCHYLLDYLTHLRIAFISLPEPVVLTVSSPFKVSTSTACIHTAFYGSFGDTAVFQGQQQSPVELPLKIHKIAASYERYYVNKKEYKW